jgi:hypothetical protein
MSRGPFVRLHNSDKEEYDLYYSDTLSSFEGIWKRHLHQDHFYTHRLGRIDGQTHGQEL